MKRNYILVRGLSERRRDGVSIKELNEEQMWDYVPNLLFADDQQLLEDFLGDEPEPGDYVHLTISDYLVFRGVDNA